MIIKLHNFRPVSINYIYRTLRGGRLYKTSKFRDTYDAIRKKVEVLDIVPVKHMLFVRIRVYLRGKRAPDVDNVAKGLLDCLNKIVWDDDAQISKLEVERFVYQPENMTVIEVYDYSNSIVDHREIVLEF